ncbi:hypothetical protein ACVIHC_008056 [Bradyrhizobium diazoefficiens]
MDWKHLAIAPRRKAITSALLYGLSLTVRFTQPTAEEATLQATQNANPATSILINQGLAQKTDGAGSSARLDIGPEKLPGGM